MLLAVAVGLVVGWLMLYRLGSLVGGLSPTEHAAAVQPVGWHGVYHDALYLPLKIVRSVDFRLFPHHGQTLTRLPNALFGALAIVSFTWLIWLWHGRRTAVIAGTLFATGAWTLHASRLASFDVLYLAAMPLMLLANVGLQRRPDKAYTFYGSLALWGVLLYVPGIVWLLIINVLFQRKALLAGWRHFSGWWQRVLYVLTGLIWLPLLLENLRQSATLRTWIGLPEHVAAPLTLLKQFGGVFVHLFVRGPEYPALWLGQAPLLDIFTLAMCLLGIYFYARRREASRSRLLASFFAAGAVLVALNGPVGLSLLVPLLYVCAATGVTYLIHEWLRVFPVNPLARNIGVGLVALAVVLACTYNLRAYFVAWPHNATTRTVFHYKT